MNKKLDGVLFFHISPNHCYRNLQKDKKFKRGTGFSFTVLRSNLYNGGNDGNTFAKVPDKGGRCISYIIISLLSWLAPARIKPQI